MVIHFFFIYLFTACLKQHNSSAAAYSPPCQNLLSKGNPELLLIMFQLGCSLLQLDSPQDQALLSLNSRLLSSLLSFMFFLYSLVKSSSFFPPHDPLSQSPRKLNPNYLFSGQLLAVGIFIYKSQLTEGSVTPPIVSLLLSSVRLYQ